MIVSKNSDIVSEDKGLENEILSSDHHFTTLNHFEEKLETQRGVNYEIYQDRQIKLNQEKAIQPDELAIWTGQRDKAFFEHMFALKWHRSRVPYLRDFQHIGVLSSPASTTPLSSELENDSKITKEYLKNVERFIHERNTVDHSISKLEALKKSLETQEADANVTSISKFLRDPLATESKKTIIALRSQLTEIESQISNTHTDFHDRWQDVFDSYKTMTQIKLDQLKERYKFYRAVSEDLSTMETTIATFPNQTLNEIYAQFKQNKSQLNLMRFCEQAIQDGYDETLKTGQNPLANVIPIFKRLYPSLSSDLQNLSNKLTTHLKNRDELLQLHRTMTEKNELITKEIEKSNGYISELEHRIANLSPLTLLTSLVGQSEKDTLNRELAVERKSLAHLSLTLNKRKQLLVRLENFLTHKSGRNLSILYRYAQQDRAQYADRDTVARCIETSYPHAIQQLIEDNHQLVANIASHVRAQLIIEYLRDLKKIENSTPSATTQERDLADSLEKFIQQPSWDELRAVQIAMHNYPQYRQQEIFKTLIDTIMALCVVAQPLPQHYLPKTVTTSASILPSSESDQVPVTDEETQAISAPQIETDADIQETLSPDYTAFMGLVSDIHNEKMKPKEAQNLGPLYAQRDALFRHYMHAEFDVRGRKSARYHIFLRLNKEKATPLLEHYYKLHDANPLKLRIFEFLIHPTWHNLERLEQTLTNNPDYYQDETLDALISEMIPLLVQSVESARSNAIKVYSSGQGYFTNRAVNEQKKALYDAIQAFNKEEHLSNSEQWNAMNTVGKLLLNLLDLSMKQPISQDYVNLLAKIKVFVTTLIAHDAERPLSENDFQAIQTNIQAFTTPTNLIRIATEFMLATAQETQEYKPKLVDATQQILRAKIEKIISPNDPANNAYKWKSVFDLIQIMRQYSDETEEASEKNIFENCMPIVQKIIAIIQYEKENTALLDELFTQLDIILAPLHDHPFKDEVEEHMKLLKKTNEYHSLASTNTDKWSDIFQLFLLMSDYSDQPQNKADQAIFKICMSFIEHIINIVKDTPEDNPLLETLLPQLDELLAPLQNHSFTEGVQHMVTLLKETDEYKLLASPSSSTGQKMT